MESEAETPTMVASLGLGSEERGGEQQQHPAPLTRRGVVAQDQHPTPGRGAVYPNPGRGRVTIPLSLPDEIAVWVDVVDLGGRVMATLADGLRLEAGYPEVIWDASQAAAGLYLVRARTATEAAVGRVVILR